MIKLCYFSRKPTFHDDPALEEEEPIYVPRSIMADIIYNNEDDLVRRRQRAAVLVELPSGAWQKRPLAAGGLTRSAVPAEPAGAAAPLAAKMGVRQRRVGKGDESRPAGEPATKSEVESQMGLGLQTFEAKL